MRLAALVALPLALASAACGRKTTPSARAHEADAARDTSCVITKPPRAIRSEIAMTPICDDVYAEDGLTDAQRSELLGALEQAAQSLLRAFETLRSSPVVLFCRSAACKLAFGAPPASAAAEDLGFASAVVSLSDGSVVPSAVVVTGPVGGTARILTHELVHAEMKAWVAYDALPTWFNEGVATFLASEPSCSSFPRDLDVTRLSTKAKWEASLRATGRTRETYCAARHEVENWMARFDGDHLRAEALRGLLTSVAGGAPFESAFAAQ